MRQQKFIPLVRLLRIPHPRILPHRPQPPAIHRRLNPARKRILPRLPHCRRSIEAVKIARPVNNLHRNSGTGLRRVSTCRSSVPARYRPPSAPAPAVRLHKAADAEVPKHHRHQHSRHQKTHMHIMVRRRLMQRRTHLPRRIPARTKQRSQRTPQSAPAKARRQPHQRPPPTASLNRLPPPSVPARSARTCAVVRAACLPPHPSPQASRSDAHIARIRSRLSGLLSRPRTAKDSEPSLHPPPSPSSSPPTALPIPSARPNRTESILQSVSASAIASRKDLPPETSRAAKILPVQHARSPSPHPSPMQSNDRSHGSNTK